MAKKDLYEILGLSKDASDAEIKSAYRKLAKKYHPDVCQAKDEKEKKEFEEKFKEISVAYEVLSDPDKKKKYDTYGSVDPNDFQGFNFNDAFGGFGGGFSFNLDEILSNMFNFGGSRRGKSASMAQDGEDLEYQLEISLEDAIYGVELEREVTRRVSCSACKGTGAKNNNAFKTCSRCQGSGHIQVEQASFFGRVLTTTTCPDCRGSGKIITEKCTECNGEGSIKKTSKIKIKIPAGINSGQQLVYQGQGYAGKNGGQSGNLIYYVYIRKNNRFERRDRDLITDITITYPDAVLGNEVTIDFFRGEKVVFDVPAGTQAGDVLRVKGKGIKDIYSTKVGDLLVRVKIDIPKKLTKEQTELIQNLARTFGDENPKDKKKSRFGRF